MDDSNVAVRVMLIDEKMEVDGDKINLSLLQRNEVT